MYKRLLLTLIPLLLVSCFKTDENEKCEDITYTSYQFVSDHNLKTYTYWFDGSMLDSLDSGWTIELSDIDTLGFNSPYLEKANSEIQYCNFDPETRVRRQVIKCALDNSGIFIKTIYSDNKTDSVFDTITFDIKGDTLLEYYTYSRWLDTLGVSFVGIKYKSVRTYIEVETPPYDLWKNGIPADPEEPDSKEKPIIELPVWSDYNPDLWQESAIYSLSKNDTDYFDISVSDSLRTYVLIKANMPYLYSEIDGGEDFAHISTSFLLDPPRYSLLFLHSSKENKKKTFSIYGNEGLYQLLVIESQFDLL